MKVCSKCKVEKDDSSFAKKTKAKDGLQTRCKSCMSITMLAVYHSGKKVWKDNARQQKRRKYDWVNEVKANCGCKLCSEVEVCCLDFHHLIESEKSATVSALIADKVSDKRIQEEIDKCIVVCANCHRKLHAGKIKLNLSPQ